MNMSKKRTHAQMEEIDVVSPNHPDSIGAFTTLPYAKEPPPREISAVSSVEPPQSHPSPSPVSKKLKARNLYAATSPFPNYPHPTPTEARQVYDVLATSLHHGKAPTRKTRPTSTNSAETCGNVPNVVEALIGTILSQNTSGRNSTKAKSMLDDAFGRNNFEGIATAPLDKVVNAIRAGGLANKKAATIQNLIRSIKNKHGQYSLQHLASTAPEIRMTDEEIMHELIAYDGVGPKTASCVLLFCLGRDSFAVDTHVFRLSKLLGWVPTGGKVDRVRAQAHLDHRIPGELKYGLHVMMIQHGRACHGCKREGSNGACALKDHLREKRRSH